MPHILIADARGSMHSINTDKISHVGETRHEDRVASLIDIEGGDRVIVLGRVEAVYRQINAAEGKLV